MTATPGPATMLLFASGLNVGLRRTLTLPFLASGRCGFQFVSLAAAAGPGGRLLLAGAAGRSTWGGARGLWRLARHQDRWLMRGPSAAGEAGASAHPLDPQACG